MRSNRKLCIIFKDLDNSSVSTCDNNKKLLKNINTLKYDYTTE